MVKTAPAVILGDVTMTMRTECQPGDQTVKELGYGGGRCPQREESQRLSANKLTASLLRNRVNGNERLGLVLQ